MCDKNSSRIRANNDETCDAIIGSATQANAGGPERSLSEMMEELHLQSLKSIRQLKTMESILQKKNMESIKSDDNFSTRLPDPDALEGRDTASAFDSNSDQKANTRKDCRTESDQSASARESSDYSVSDTDSLKQNAPKNENKAGAVNSNAHSTAFDATSLQNEPDSERLPRFHGVFTYAIQRMVHAICIFILMVAFALACGPELVNLISGHPDGNQEIQQTEVGESDRIEDPVKLAETGGQTASIPSVQSLKAESNVAIDGIASSAEQIQTKLFNHLDLPPFSDQESTMSGSYLIRDNLNLPPFAHPEPDVAFTEDHSPGSEQGMPFAAVKNQSPDQKEEFNISNLEMTGDTGQFQKKALDFFRKQELHSQEITGEFSKLSKRVSCLEEYTIQNSADELGYKHCQNASVETSEKIFNPKITGYSFDANAITLKFDEPPLDVETALFNRYHGTNLYLKILGEPRTLVESEEK